MNKNFDRLMAKTVVKDIKGLKAEGDELYQIKVARETSILEGVKTKVIKSEALKAEAKAIRAERAAAKKKRAAAKKTKEGKKEG